MLFGENFVLENGWGLFQINSINPIFWELAAYAGGKLGWLLPKGSRSLLVFDAFGHEEIALDKNFALVPPPNLNEYDDTKHMEGEYGKSFLLDLELHEV